METPQIQIGTEVGLSASLVDEQNYKMNVGTKDDQTEMNHLESVLITNLRIEVKPAADVHLQTEVATKGLDWSPFLLNIIHCQALARRFLVVHQLKPLSNQSS